MIAHYIYGVAVLYHKRRTVHSIFQIPISQNTKCVDKNGFPRPSHICKRSGYVNHIKYILTTKQKLS